MKNINLKFRALERRKDRLDDFVWKIFHRYIQDNNINFNRPNSWDIQGELIRFEGSDGCRGCYDSMGLSIPIEYFENYEDSIKKKLDIEKEKKEQKARQEREHNF